MSEGFDNADAKTPAEIVDEVEHELEAEGDEGFVEGSSATMIRIGRARH